MQSMAGTNSVGQRALGTMNKVPSAMQSASQQIPKDSSSLLASAGRGFKKMLNSAGRGTGPIAQGPYQRTPQFDPSGILGR